MKQVHVKNYSLELDMELDITIIAFLHFTHNITSKTGFLVRQKKFPTTEEMQYSGHLLITWY